MTTIYTLLYTDVVESTRLAASQGEPAMTLLWRAHDRIARDLIVAWQGREIEKTDGLLVIFESTAHAVSYAAAYHRALSSLDPPMKARVGLHVAHIGLRTNTEADKQHGAMPLEVEGIAKAIVSRTMSAAMGGQTLMTADARIALGVVSARIRSHGHWRFKGLLEPIELFETGDERSPFLPPPDAEKAYRVVRQGDLWKPIRQIPNNLPAERDQFVGRDETLQVLAHKIESGSRLLSVLGVGGAGKTRLAVHYGWTWLGEYPGGVWICDLAQARTLDGVFFEVASALDVPLGKTASELQLAHAIAGRGRCLIIFDTFEQVVRYADETLGRWLDKAPQATFIVTTREVLGIPGEDTLALGPLPNEDAIALFVRRVEAVKHGYNPPEEEGLLIRQLVSMLDGLPLAIELAAARTRVMSTKMLLSRMNERFKVLWSVGRRRDRQATMRATFDWSWDLLSEVEKAAMAQLSVFEGGFTLETAQPVVELSAIGPAPWIPDLLQGLVDKSFVRLVSDDRFDLLESIREYAAEHLCGEGSFMGSGAAACAAAQARHFQYFAAMTEHEALAHHGIEANNLLAACRRACQVVDRDAAVGALRASWSAMRLSGPFRVVVDLAKTVAGIPDLSDHQRLVIDSVTSDANYALGRVEVARGSAEAGLRRAMSVGDKSAEARFLCALSEHREAGSDPVMAFQLLDRALSLALDISDDEMTCKVKSAQGNLCYETGRPAEARVHYMAALATARRSHDERWEGGILGNLGNLMFGEGRLEEAQGLYEQCLALAERTGDRRWQGNMRCNLGMVHYEQGRIGLARQAFRESLAIARAMGHAHLECNVLCNLGLVLESESEPKQAIDYYDAAVGLANELADWRAEGQFRGYLGLLLAKTGDIEASLACLRKGEELLTRAADQASLGLLLCRRAEAEQIAGRPEAAGQVLARAEAIANEENASANSELRKAVAVMSNRLNVSPGG